MNRVLGRRQVANIYAGDMVHFAYVGWALVVSIERFVGTEDVFRLQLLFPDGLCEATADAEYDYETMRVT